MRVHLRAGGYQTADGLPARISAMGSESARKRTKRRWPRASTLMVLVTALACLSAVLFRTPLRSRFWAARVIAAQSAADRAAYLTLLCNAGDAGRWGTAVLLDHPEAEFRQFGVLVLHNVRSGWSRGRLLGLLSDSDESVRELAALGLALHGEQSVIPHLQRIYESDATESAALACAALGRIATPQAVAALTELVPRPGGVSRRAALVDALAAIGTAACVPALLELLSDDRAYTQPTREARLASELLANLSPAQRAGIPAEIPSSLPTVAPTGRTIAERAAFALVRITGVDPGFSSDQPPSEREQARRAWASWQASESPVP
jgi:hypothetical protein